MHSSSIREGLVVGIILLFIGTSVLPSVSGTPSSLNNKGDEHRQTELILNSTQETDYYAIIVACSQYKNASQSLPPPPFPPVKSEVFKKLYNSLVKTENWDESHITLLLNENATKHEIIKALNDVAVIIKPQDIFLFFWFGHGTMIPDTDGDEALYNPDDTYDEALCPYDTTSASDVISDDELDFYFSQINAKGMCLIFDCCFSGGLISNDHSMLYCFKKGLSDDIMKKPLHACDVNGTNRIVIMSTLDNCVTGGFALNLYVYGSTLMVSLTDAFDRYAKDKNSDGFISIEEAFTAVRLSHILKTNMYLIVYWIAAVISIKTGLWRRISKVPIFKNIYNIPFIKKIMAYFYNEKKTVLSATKITLLLWINMKIITRLKTGYPLINWVTMNDAYQGELPIIKL